ncbi:response regulator [Streptomyces albidoflavus]|uniref:response regulator n=1 Tax=Streptomyces albidoflavus TaxID=1886 RepID=UPI0033FC5518
MTLSGSGFRVLIVDDEPDIAERLQSLLTRRLTDLGTVTIETEDDFAEAERRLGSEQFDLTILDVKDGGSALGDADADERGRDMYERVAQKCWIPVIFCTGFPQRVESLKRPPLVNVVTKNHLADLVEAVRAALESGVPSLTRQLGAITDRFMRSFLRDTIAPNWEEMAESDQQEIPLVLVNQLAAWLKENAVRELDSVISANGGNVVGHSSAARVYLKPPVTHHVTAADILASPTGDWWLVLTPACDLYEDLPTAEGDKKRRAKAEFVRLARAHVLHTSPPVADWQANGGNKQRVSDLFRTDHNRYRVLPKYLDVPDLLVDFEDVMSFPLDEVRGLRRVATLDSPFAEAMLTGHSRAVGRIGTPDIDFERQKEELGLKGNKRQVVQPAVPAARGTEPMPISD